MGFWQAHPLICPSCLNVSQSHVASSYITQPFHHLSILLAFWLTKNILWKAEVENWWLGVGAGVEGWGRDPAHTVLKSRYVWFGPQSVMNINCYEHISINRHPSKARFPGSFEKGEDLGLGFPQSTNQLAWNVACPLRSPPSPGPKSSATALAWYLDTY